MTGQRASSNSGDERVMTGTSQQAGSSNIRASGSVAMVGHPEGQYLLMVENTDRGQQQWAEPPPEAYRTSSIGNTHKVA